MPHCRTLALLACLSVLPAGSTLANPLEAALAERWQDTWVVLKTEARSDCDIFHTKNTVTGYQAESWGDYHFERGELGRISMVDVKRQHIVVRIAFAEPVLTAVEDGPFELFRERRCKVQLRIDVPRTALDGFDLQVAESRLVAAMARYRTPDDAVGDRRWNRRQRDPYPADYATTLDAWACWKEAEQLLEEL